MLRAALPYHPHLEHFHWTHSAHTKFSLQSSYSWSSPCVWFWYLLCITPYCHLNICCYINFQASFWPPHLSLSDEDALMLVSLLALCFRRHRSKKVLILSQCRFCQLWILFSEFPFVSWLFISQPESKLFENEGHTGYNAEEVAWSQTLQLDTYHYWSLQHPS